jgi:hypothetical protein
LPGALIRRALAFVLLASALKLLGASTPVTGLILALLLALAGPAWMVLRRAHGFTAWPGGDRHAVAAPGAGRQAAAPAGGAAATD